ncbi:hypothetical protein IM816_18025 [Luteibacter flocculans]|uniref:Conjugal transfer protein TrbH n=1 Tax=Luteibacter flocculans TaxID=2780091 RepID=A0ABY4T552_9GAMM|nr:hypothetical protein [Luteibacter flocculans]URL58455.1 hypothetical protein IM816_18025 [Luteibacter flocculans]
MKRAVVLALTVCLVGCTPLPPRRSTVADTDPLRRAVVADVVAGVSEVYEPTQTVLVPTHPMDGAFGVALLAALRAQGFRIGESVVRGTPFDCSVDRVEGSLYRVTAAIGSTVLSRLWVFDGERAYTGGAWTRRE